MKPYTLLNSEVVNGYVVLSKLLSTTDSNWWEDGNRSLYFDSNGPKQPKCFASWIHEGNVFECMRLSMANLNLKCECHRDQHNSNNPTFNTVVGMSVVCKVHGKDVPSIATNAQAWKSIDKCMA
jgi:hypothetical protein